MVSSSSLWLKQLHTWHWISSALALVGMLLFAITGITLNHAAQIEAEPRIVKKTVELPSAMAGLIHAELPTRQGSQARLSAPVAQWIENNFDVDVSHALADWSDNEIYFSLPKAGGDAWLQIDPQANLVQYQLTDRGWIALINDLHKGRHAGEVWHWFIDVFAVACLVFCITGLVILKYHAGNRPLTWPVVAFGLLVPLVLVLLFVH
ncbi:PepSY-associated TM helix domain-containing protein [Limnobacter sp.]|uniref:PepSY-associated TM helix domain-containing protein n=1 Tax=Limnobacter sp. TaxID=2003368 RepID=UPI002E36DB5D|nr:PepSY-associated TM helix domain-containing protein [Limnobacter sp.]